MTVTARPLVVTSDPAVLDDLLRLAALAGVEVEVATDAARAEGPWAAAPAVLVGPDAVADCLRMRLPRRPGVTLIGADEDDGGVWQTAVSVGAEHVVFLPDAEPWLVDLLADAAGRTVAAGSVVGVIGGRGGAGATTIAVALAVCASQSGLTTWLIDADPLGGGIDLVLGGEHAPGLRWSDLAHSRGRVPGDVLAQGLPALHGVSVLAVQRDAEGLPPVAALTAVVDAARRTADLVVVDLPRRLDPKSTHLVRLLDTCLLVTPCELRAAAASAQVASALRPLCPDVRLVTRGPAPAGLQATDVERVVGVPLAVAMRAQNGMPALLERGDPPGLARGPLLEACGSLLSDLLPAARAA
ncbi:MAG: septum site-determining protein Ssd [Mycobacteriales bacterium]